LSRTNFGATGFLNPAVNNIGNNGNFNQFEGIGGNDTITGNGNTRIIYSSATDAVTINLQQDLPAAAVRSTRTRLSASTVRPAAARTNTYNAAGFTGVSSAGSFGTSTCFEGLAGNDIITATAIRALPIAGVGGRNRQSCGQARERCSRQRYHHGRREQRPGLQFQRQHHRRLR